jgi:hypothetical protein
MRRTPAALYVTLFLAACSPVGARAESATPDTQLQSSVNDLNAWLGNNDNGQRWRQYLRMDELTAQLAQASAADRDAVAAVLERYESGTPGLERQRFQAVRRALVAWHSVLMQPKPGELAQAARDAAGKFQPITPEAAAQAKTELAAAMSQLEQFLNRSGPANAAAWKTYLAWNELAALVQSNDPPNPAAVNALAAKYQTNHVGLEMPQFMNVRVALENYAALAVAAANAMQQEEYAARLDALAKDLEAYAADPAAGDAAINIGRTLDWLASRRQAPELVNAISQAYSQPNLYAYASERFAAAGIEDPVNEITPVRDNILGTSIYGTAHMTGHTRFAFTENPNAAGFNIFLTGQAASNNVGYNRGVTIYTTGLTQISGSKYLQMTEAGMMGWPAAACCNTSTHINGICARGPLVERIAWKRAGQQQGQAQAIASDHAEVRVANRMNQKAGEMIAEQNQKYYEKFRNPLIRKGAFPELLRFSSTADRGLVRVLQASGGKLGAPAAPPQQPGSHDMALTAHESSVVNFGEDVLGGYYMTDLRLEKLLRDDLKTEVPEDLRMTMPDGTIDQDKEPWAIQFARELPVRAKFSGGKLWLAIRADAFFRGQDDPESSYNRALAELIEISASYTIEKTEAGATLRREGDVVVNFPEAKPGEQSTRRVGAAAFLRVKFRNLFKEEFVGEGLKLKGRFERVGVLRLQEIASDAGWISLGWQLPSAAPAPTAPAPAAPAPAAAPSAE